MDNQFQNTALSTIRECYSVCEHHFETCMFQTAQREKLNRNARPTLLLPRNGNGNGNENRQAVEAPLLDSHSFIVLKDLGNRLLYPSKTFIDIIDLVKKEVLSAFISHINEYRIFDVIKSNINVDMGEICPNHTNIADNIIFGTIFIFVKHIIMILNRKMHLKDLRSYPPLDRYLKNYAPLIYHKR
ncbi:unnamed protein product [Tenebrio molitor]|jgi:hypothetical protein|nr:unnamed protein product [Tenebrio molitor]